MWGPLTMTISQQEALVTFNTRSKKFEETADFERAKQLFVSAPEGWYVILKNPTSDNKYPEAGQANTSPNTIKIGTKVNIPGPANFALYPGQMAKTVRGHKLRSNQYLLARVYDAAAADLQKIIDQIKDAELEREKKEDAVRIEYQKQLAAIKKDEQTAYAETVAKIMESVSDELVAALESRANADMLETVSKAVSPYAIAQNESVSETVNRLLRGTSLEDTINNIVKNKME